MRRRACSMVNAGKLWLCLCFFAIQVNQRECWCTSFPFLYIWRHCVLLFSLSYMCSSGELPLKWFGCMNDLFHLGLLMLYHTRKQVMSVINASDSCVLLEMIVKIWASVCSVTHLQKVCRRLFNYKDIKVF